MQRFVALSATVLLTLLGLAFPACAAVTERSVYYSYDVMGRQLSARFDSQAGPDGLTNEYNGFGELTSTTLTMGTFSKTLSSHYDGAGRRDQLIHPESNDTYTFTYGYDALGRLSGVYEGAGATTPLETFSYTNAGLPYTRSEGAGTSNVTYGWDDVGRLTSQTDAFASGTNNVGWSFGLNPASQIISETRDNEGYAYTGLVNVNRAYKVNGLNQYTSVGAVVFAYDDNGNLISDGTNSYIYDVENRLVSASATVNGQAVTTSLTYDPMGRLFRVVKTTAGVTGSDTRFLYDGDALIAEYDASGNVINRYVHGSNAAADDPLVWYAGADLSSRRFLHADHLGSIVAVTNCNAGNECINRYDEYGVPQTDAATHTTNLNAGRFQYTGQAWLGEIGMYYYKARIYSPTLGRFLQTDPIGYKDQVNLYAYVGDDPLNLKDSNGNEIVEATHDLFAGISHTKIVIIPENQAAYAKNPNFQNTFTDGRRYATIGAGPENGILVSAVNRPTDLNMYKNNFAQQLELPRSKTEDQIIQELFKADRNYKDNLDYDLLPNGLFGTGANGYNSNSYATGLLESVGIKPANLNGSVVPGTHKPVPRAAFENDSRTSSSQTKTICTGSRIPKDGC